MPGPLLKQNRQDQCINNLYVFYDAVHKIEISKDIAVEAREFILFYLQKKIEILKNELSSSKKEKYNEIDETDLTLIFGDFTYSHR